MPDEEELHEQLDLLELEIKYKNEVVAFFSDKHNMEILEALTDQIAILNRALPGLHREMELMRGAIDRMPRRY